MLDVIILAAGQGKRLKELTRNMPKPLIEIHGKPIIFWTLDNLNLFANKINKVIVAVGYKKEMLFNRISNRYKNLKIEYVENPIFDKTNNIYSLYLCNNKLTSKTFFIIESDIILDFDGFSTVFDSINEEFIACKVFLKGMDGAKIISDKNGDASELIITRNKSKEVMSNEFKSIGIMKFKREFMSQIKKRVDDGKVNDYYDLAVADYIKQKKIALLDIHKAKWWEVDTTDDLAIASQLLGEKCD